MKKGFSLVELSIVLVILGLLTGGILAGQSLIRASELRAVSVEYQRYIAAKQTFRDKYFALPGDMTNATTFWTAQDAGDGLGVDCTDVPSTTQATCNGNGDGFLVGYEFFRFWQQLANAGLIEGTYTGARSVAGQGNSHAIGTNAPRSKLANAGWSNRYMNSGDYAGTFFATEKGNAMIFGAQSTNFHTLANAIKPEEAWNIDTKMDDGKPAYGMVGSNFTTCTTAGANNVFTADYALTTTSTSCALVFPYAL
ncbi:MAG: prepilin-type N-terminal cleavage/methylation domain-containing protein [Alphaproteobacteria bacterium]|nr:prepilin-type N-terminal cleavage/methylation domain-containing protein [Alphaproteobacteria bacterium]